MPHVCGDEPNGNKTKVYTVAVCPTYVGMNRIPDSPATATMSMPHVCGDEPHTLHNVSIVLWYAPRMWG